MPSSASSLRPESTVSGLAAGSARAARGRWLAIASDIKLAHSVFALPFAVLAAFLARPEGSGWAWPFAGQLALVVVCMVTARTWAMLVNRLADRRFDAANPRTTGRALPSGRVAVADMRIAAAVSALAFAGCAWAFLPIFGNPWPGWLCAAVLGWIALYSFTKRFTAACHVFLGGALAASPVAAAIAVNPAALADRPAILLLAGMVLVWVAGFDIIYALADIDFDRSAGLKSIPARLGWRRAVVLSRLLHAAAAALLVAAWRNDDRLGVLFGTAVALVGGLLVMEHVVLARKGPAGLSMAFFTLNGVVSCVVGAAGCLDVMA